MVRWLIGSASRGGRVWALNQAMSERGFTLIEMVVVVAILAILAVAGGVWMFGMRPGALLAAADSYDGALTAARGIASSSGNGATLAFLPRIDAHGKPLGGFTLAVYRGRPTSTGAMTPSNVMTVTSGARVAERTFGAPPFALFLSSAGHATGIGVYPRLNARAQPTWTPIATQPPCPTGGILLTFSTPKGARVTRSLACASSAVGFSLPNPSPTPNVPRLTPTQLIFHWPGDALQRVLATEWGYTHWFASASGFACAGGVVAYPVAPLPYQVPPTQTESTATPQPPPNAPYSYPSSAGSMNDAPAPFPIQPQSAGTCAIDVVDDFSQHANAIAHVMGAFSAAPNALAWPVPSDHSLQSVEFSKIDDDEALRPSITSNTCNGIVRVGWTAQSSPQLWTDTASATLGTVPVLDSTGKNNVGGKCTLVVTSQYPGEPSVSVAINVQFPSGTLSVFPASVTYGANDSSALAYVRNPSGGSDVRMALLSRVGFSIGKLLNVMLFGGTVDATTMCGRPPRPCGPFPTPHRSPTPFRTPTPVPAPTPTPAPTAPPRTAPPSPPPTGWAIYTSGTGTNASGVNCPAQATAMGSGPPAWMTALGAAAVQNIINSMNLVTSGPNIGCFNGQIAVSEPGYTGAFAPSNPCLNTVNFNGWNATNTGPQANLITSGGDVGSCTFSIGGSSGETASIAANVVRPYNFYAILDTGGSGCTPTPTCSSRFTGNVWGSTNHGGTWFGPTSQSWTVFCRIVTIGGLQKEQCTSSDPYEADESTGTAFECIPSSLEPFGTTEQCAGTIEPPTLPFVLESGWQLSPSVP